jgi:hypothetical protein
MRALNPGKTAADFKKWREKNPDWVEYNKEQKKGISQKGEFIPIDSEGQDYPMSDFPEKDEYDNRGVLFPPHGTYLWGAYSHNTLKAVYLTDPRSKGMVKYKLSVKAVFDYLLNDVKSAFGAANYVMFGMSYDMTQLLCQLPHDVTYEIFKGLRWEDEHEFDAPVFWGEYAIKLVQSKWFILWRLRDHNHPYKVDDKGEYVLDKKGRMQLDAVQKIQIFETFGYFQTGFAKVVEDMMKEQSSSANKQMMALNDKANYINSSQFETDAVKSFEGKPLGHYYIKDGVQVEYTLEQKVKGERTYAMLCIAEQRAKIGTELNLLAKDAALIKEM